MIFSFQFGCSVEDRRTPFLPQVIHSKSSLCRSFGSVCLDKGTLPQRLRVRRRHPCLAPRVFRRLSPVSSPCSVPIPPRRFQDQTPVTRTSNWHLPDLGNDLVFRKADLLLPRPFKKLFLSSAPSQEGGMGMIFSTGCSRITPFWVFSRIG